jgi:hypothetical protein
MNVKPDHWHHAASVMLNGVKRLGVELKACTDMESYPAAPGGSFAVTQDDVNGTRNLTREEHKHETH